MAIDLEKEKIWPPLPLTKTDLGIPRSLLYTGSRFVGQQTSKGNGYDVEVILQHVDEPNAYLCGYLKIKGLTDEFPDLTTFFQGEIIGAKHPFLTRKWDADEDIDRKHWSKFGAFDQFSKNFNTDDFAYSILQTSDYVFMRWKEQFLIPDHRVRDLHGASFAGFYYILLSRSSGTIEGYYFHKNSEWFQSLQLSHSAERTFSVYEFR
uniref:Glucose-induced degradation protein 4 homolog n=1 Tax=Romanomermis culicivorax TaxID=13658 RepID=A0A915I7U4_ROMCU